MLDARVYRAAFVPALVALFVVAFSLGDRPSPATTRIAPDAFDAVRAAQALEQLADAFPARLPGSPGERALADRVEADLGRAGFEVRREGTEADTIEGDTAIDTVIGVRPGLSSRRIVLAAHRDAAERGGRAELSATAALLELARIFGGRDVGKTIVLVSTSGGTGGAAGLRAFAEREARGGLTDALLVLGDMAGRQVRKPWVVPWGNGHRQAPIALRRTVERALRTETGADPGGARAPAQWARRALPMTISPQGEADAAGLPAVFIGVSGERGPREHEPVSQGRLQSFGRGVLRAVNAIEAAGGGSASGAVRPGAQAADPGPAFAADDGEIVTVRRVLPGWAARLLVGTLLLPALVAAVDAFFRARRRGLPMARWTAWAAAGALPFVAAYAWVRLLGAAGGIDALPAPAPPDAVPLEGAAWVALASVPLAFVLGWAGLRMPALVALGLRGDPAAGGGAAASGLLLVLLVGAVWAANPYAAGVLLPAAHAWLLVCMPGRRLGAGAAVAAVMAGLLLPILLVVHLMGAFSLGPLEGVWFGAVALAGGHVSVPGALAMALLGGLLWAVVLILRARGRLAAAAPPEPVVTRGPAGYAGPGSLGGTESALRR